MVGICENNLGIERFDVGAVEALHCGLCTDGHENWRFDVSVGSMKYTDAGGTFTGFFSLGKKFIHIEVCFCIC